MSTPTAIEETAAESAPPPQKKQTPKVFSELQLKFRAARRVSTPLIATKTPDPAATMMLMEATLNGSTGDTPVLHWDIARGLQWRNDAGLKAIWYDLLDKDPGEPLPESDADKAALSVKMSQSGQAPFNALTMILKAPSKTIVFFANAHRAIPTSPAVSQAIWNLRDVFKRNRRTLVMLCPDITLPAELQQDVLILDEPLPDRAHLSAIVKGTYDAGKLPVPDPETIEKAVDALSGLAAFPAEQATAMSLTRIGVDLPDLWERKRKLIEATPGLTVNRSGETFDDIGGVENAKNFFRQVLAGAEPPRAIIFLDEIEKSFGGSGDTSGVSQGFLGTMLAYMQDHSANGSILVGPPGAAKSMIAKAVGNTGGIPTIAFDMNGMKASLVGESEQRLRTALKVVTAVSQDRAMFVGTCNSFGSLPPELRRRFSFGTFFFDLPVREEREVIWSIYIRKYNLFQMSGLMTAAQTDACAKPPDDGWTGAEIKQCCFLSYNLRISLLEAAKFIVPVARSAAETIQKLREESSGKFISASKPGLYQYERERKQVTKETTGRALDLE